MGKCLKTNDDTKGDPTRWRSGQRGEQNEARGDRQRGTGPTLSAMHSPIWQHSPLSTEQSSSAQHYRHICAPCERLISHLSLKTLFNFKIMARRHQLCPEHKARPTLSHRRTATQLISLIESQLQPRNESSYKRTSSWPLPLTRTRDRAEWETLFKIIICKE